MQTEITALWNKLSLRLEHRILAAMLLLLHLALWWEFGKALSISMMIAHLGLFLLWQPLLRGDRRLDLTGGVLFLIFMAGFIGTLSWWSVSGWLLLLIGLAGGRSLTNRPQQYAYMLTLFFLASELLIGAVPRLFELKDLPAELMDGFKYGLFCIPLLLALIPVQGTTSSARFSIDLFRGVTASLMTAFVALGSLLVVYRTSVAYPIALFQSLIALAGFLFALSWLLSSRTGAAGLGQLWERSLLNIGTPFEQWLTDLARLADQQQTPKQFLDAAMTELVKLPWVLGVSLQSDEGGGERGGKGKHVIHLSIYGIDAMIYIHQAAGLTLLLHAKLLIELLGHFFIAKVREQEHSRQAHLRAIHETGARITHDIKNLLQSLQTMTMVLTEDSTAAPDGEERRRRASRGRLLIEKQLPLITQRLQLALDKLQSPEKTIVEEKGIREWWESFKARNQTPGVSFHDDIRFNLPISADLLDSVAENLLENARNKKLLDPAIQIAVELRIAEDAFRLAVHDTGDPVPADQAQRLFKQPLPSSTGLGVGLYQAARQAEILGYSLRLAENAARSVCFELIKTELQKGPSHPQYPLFSPRP